MMKSQTSDTERDKLIKDDIKMKIYKIIKQNERISNNFKKKFKNILWVCIYKNGSLLHQVSKIYK